MTWRGRVKGGGVVLDEAVPLPDGTEVEVSVARPAAAEAPGQDLMKYAGQIDDLPEDASINLDHYLYGDAER